jgi:hypothetical protein
MALPPLSSFTSDAVTVGVAGAVGDAVPLQVPLYDGEKIVIDLTPGDDDWLRILNANTSPMKHHVLDEAEALHMAAQLSEDNAKLLLELDNKIRLASGYSTLGDSVSWKAMANRSGKTVMNIVLKNSVAPTRISMLKDDHFLDGAGAEFLNERLQGKPLADFMCKATVELECIHRSNTQIGVTISLHHLVLTPIPKRTRVEYSDTALEAALRAAKRLKYEF